MTTNVLALEVGRSARPAANFMAHTIVPLPDGVAVGYIRFPAVPVCLDGEGAVVELEGSCVAGDRLITDTTAELRVVDVPVDGWIAVDAEGVELARAEFCNASARADDLAGLDFAALCAAVGDVEPYCFAGPGFGECAAGIARVPAPPSAVAGVLGSGDLALRGGWRWRLSGDGAWEVWTIDGERASVVATSGDLVALEAGALRRVLDVNTGAVNDAYLLAAAMDDGVYLGYPPQAFLSEPKRFAIVDMSDGGTTPVTRYVTYDPVLPGNPSSHVYETIDDLRVQGTTIVWYGMADGAPIAQRISITGGVATTEDLPVDVALEEMAALR